MFQSAVKAAIANLNVEIVKRSDQASGFVVLPKRWVVERTFAWLNRMPPSGQRLGMPEQESPRLCAACVPQAHGTKVRQDNGMIPDRLLYSPLSLNQWPHSRQ